MALTCSQRRLIIAIIPAIAVGLLFECFLGHRHDYAGHYLAGYGGTLAAYMFTLKLMSPARFAAWGIRAVLPLCLGCILLGGVMEATMFNIAKFDELDFFNQSLGAVLAGIVTLSYTSPERPAAYEFDWGLIAGIAFLGAGGCFAVA
jgi:hypothetical protein